MNQGIAGDIKAVMPAVIASGLLESLCTITVPPGVFDEGGAPDPTAAYIPLTGHIDILCTAPPLGIGDIIKPTEVKEISEILSKNLLNVWLGGYYPAIISTYRAVVDGIEYDIIGTESDSQKTQTRLAVQKATV